MRSSKNTARRPQQILELFFSHAQVLLCSVGVHYDRTGEQEAADAAATAEELPRAPIARPQRPPPPANPLWGPRRAAAAETPGAAAASTHST